MYSHFDDERDPYEEDRQQEKSLTCNRCGKDDGLYWLPNHTGTGFVMYDENGLHRCAMPATVDDFEVIN